MAKTKSKVSDKVRRQQHHCGAAACVFHRVQCTRKSDHTESQFTKIV